MYEKYFKRICDIICAISALVIFWWLYLILAGLVRLRLGSPVLFTQFRPGRIDKRTGRERIFKLYKFRTMTEEKDEHGNLLPDGKRLTPFGEKLRASSLDELPEVWNILKGDMSLIGPRPQLIKDMVFMTKEQRRRHLVRPGLSGLAQVRGRNAASWESRLETDLEYIKKITFIGDLKIILATAVKVFREEGITEKGMATSMDLGDHLLEKGMIGREIYEKKQRQASVILQEAGRRDQYRHR